MEKVKRSYYLSPKLIALFDKDCTLNGHVKEKVVAAAICEFLESSPQKRATCFGRLDKFLKGKRISN